jgi:hypothetical protein
MEDTTNTIVDTTTVVDEHTRRAVIRATLQAAKEGNVDLFAKLAAPNQDELAQAIVNKTYQIFYSQQLCPFGSTRSEDLQAAYREATIFLDKGAANSEIAEAAATDTVKKLAEEIHRMHLDNQPEYHVECFLESAYQVRHMFRTPHQEQEQQ